MQNKQELKRAFHQTEHEHKAGAQALKPSSCLPEWASLEEPRWPALHPSAAPRTEMGPTCQALSRRKAGLWERNLKRAGCSEERKNASCSSQRRTTREILKKVWKWEGERQKEYGNKEERRDSQPLMVLVPLTDSSAGGTLRDFSNCYLYPRWGWDWAAVCMNRVNWVGVQRLKHKSIFFF